MTMAMASTHVDTHTYTYSMSQIHSLIFHGHHTYTLPETDTFAHLKCAW